MPVRGFFIDALVGLVFAGGMFAADSKTDPKADTQAARIQVWQKLVSDGLKAAGVKDYPTAEQFLVRALHEADSLPASDARAGSTANMLGLVYKEEKKYREAEDSFGKALGLLQKAYGPESLDVGNVMFNMAGILLAERRDDSALPYIQKTQAIYAKVVGVGSLKVASTQCMAGEAYRDMKKLRDAEDSLKQCADTREAAGGVDNAEFGDALYSLGLVYQQEERYPDAEKTLKMAEKIREVALGITSPGFADALEAHASVLRQLGQTGEAAREEGMAAAIRNKRKQ